MEETKQTLIRKVTASTNLTDTFYTECSRGCQKVLSLRTFWPSLMVVGLYVSLILLQ